MPRFLNTSTGEFEWHGDPTRVTYAILSHTWRSPQDGGEQSYDEVRALQTTVAEAVRIQQLAVLAELNNLETTQPSFIPRCISGFSVKGSTRSTILTHSKLSDKNKSICRVAREGGYRLVWNDACCIDKSSSAELSEAINSMFEWYRLSDICYVHLEDVPDDAEYGVSYTFWESKWHTRGWTLQELLAPANVEFLTKTWRLLGTKIGLASTLEKITGVDFRILVGHEPVDSASIARRMSWAAERRTTRVEDAAYCLMGIFGVHMSPIYGEGNNAFLRLQEEIVRTIPDQSIFAWGPGCTLRSVYRCDDIQLDIAHHPGLFASRPKNFKEGYDITPISPAALASRLRLKGSQEVLPLHCVFTPQGVRVQLLCLKLGAIPGLSETSWWEHKTDPCPDCMRSQAIMFALLQCEDKHGSLIALPLCQARGEAGSGRGMLIGTHIQCSRSWHGAPRFLRLTKGALAEALEHVSPALVEVFLLRHDSVSESCRVLPGAFRRKLRLIALWPGDRDDGMAFRIAPRNIEALGTIGFVVNSSLQVSRSEREITMQVALTCNGGDRFSPAGECPHSIQFTLTLTRDGLRRWDTSVCFSVANFVGVPANTSPPSYAMRRTPCFDGDEGQRRSPHALHSRVITSADFVVHSDSDWEKTTCTVRLLRISLERPLDSASAPKGRFLWLSIQISEKYRYTQSIYGALGIPPLLRTEDGAPSQVSSDDLTGDDVEAITSSTNSARNTWINSVPSDQSLDSTSSWALTPVEAQPKEPWSDRSSMNDLPWLELRTPLHQHDQSFVACAESFTAPPAVATQLAPVPFVVYQDPLIGEQAAQLEGGWRPAWTSSVPPPSPEHSEAVKSQELIPQELNPSGYDRHEYHALRTQMEMMSSQIADLRSKNAVLSSQVAVMLAQLSTLCASQGGATRPKDPM